MFTLGKAHTSIVKYWLYYRIEGGIYMLVGRRLREARKEKGLTQEALGNLIGVGKSAICCYEKESRNPTLESIIELIDVLGVSADYLLGTDVIVDTKSKEHPKYRTMTNEEITFVDEIKKEKIVYEILFEDPKRGADLVKKKIG